MRRGAADLVFGAKACELALEVLCLFALDTLA